MYNLIFVLFFDVCIIYLSKYVHSNLKTQEHRRYKDNEDEIK